MSRLVNLDAADTTTFTIGARDFVVRPQRRALIEKVMEAAYQAETEGSEQSTFVQSLFKNWDRQFPMFALIFGYEDPKDPETKGVLKHLEQHLSPRGGVEVFKDWWEINGIDDFFIRGGRPMMPLDIVESLRSGLREKMDQAVLETIPNSS
jgi:hypothetical protein